MFPTTCSAAHCERLRHFVLLSALASFIINMQCWMLLYLPDMTFPHNGCNANDSSEGRTQRYLTDMGGGIILFWRDSSTVQHNKPIVSGNGTVGYAVSVLSVILLRESRRNRFDVANITPFLRTSRRVT